MVFNKKENKLLETEIKFPQTLRLKIGIFKIDAHRKT